MFAIDLPETLFVRGGKSANTSFQFYSSYRDVNDVRFLCVWSTEALLKEWLSKVGGRTEYSHFSRDIFIQGLCVESHYDYLVFNPSPVAGDFNSGVSITSIPSVELVGIKYASDLLPFLPESMKDDVRIVVQRHPKFKSMEAMSYISNCLTLPSIELKTRGMFESAREFFRDKLLNSGSQGQRFFSRGEWIQLLLDVMEIKPELTFISAMEYIRTFEALSIHTLKEMKVFDAVEKLLKTEMLSKGSSEGSFQSIRETLAANEQMTLTETRALMQQILQAEENTRFVTKDCSFPETCVRCGESDWEIVSISPNRKSATIACNYCGRKEVLLAGVRQNLQQRQPIPKEVQREVWQRDQGKCIECGSKENLEFDHIIPVVRGGGNTARNLQLLCEKCNRRKTDNSPGNY